MLSFLLCLGMASAQAAQRHGVEIAQALAQRSFLEESAPTPTLSPQTLHHAGDEGAVLRGRRWKLLRASLSRCVVGAEELQQLQRIHAQLQEFGPYAAQQYLSEELQKLEDSAAWVAWSAQDQCALVFRDPLGKVPLYLLRNGSSYMVTNTRLALEPWLVDEPLGSEAALAALLVGGSPATHRETAFRSLERVPPGSLVHLSASHAPIHQRWWHWRAPVIKALPPEEASERYRSLFLAALARERELSTVVVELSAGMDSTSILAGLRTLEPTQTLHALNYSHGPEDEERQLAAALCTQLGVSLRTASMKLPPERYFPDPYAGGSLTGTLAHLSELAGPKEVFSGHGGDNLFMVSRADMDRMGRELSPLRLAQQLRLHQKIHGRLPPLFLRERLQGLPDAHMLRDRRIPWLTAPIAALVADLAERNFNEDLPKTGRDGMAYSLRWTTMFELADPGFHGTSTQYRFPFFDLSLMRFVASLPPAPYLYDKHVARSAWRSVLPEAIRCRPKTFDAVDDPSVLFQSYDPALLEQPQLPAWLLPEPLKQLLRSPETFPSWIYPTARATLDLLRWQYHSEKRRLTIATHTARHL